MTLEYPFDSDNLSELYENILKGIKNKKILNEEGNHYNDIFAKKYSKDFLDIVDEMMTLEPEKRPNIEDILEKKIVIERMDSLLRENKFNLDSANFEIKRYQENEQKILNLIQKRLIEQKKQYDDNDDYLNIEDINEEEDISRELIKDEVQTQREIKKLRYNFLRQMSLIHKERLKRNKTI